MYMCNPILQAVEGIVDHHADNGAYPDVTGDQRKIAFDKGNPLVASACSLVVEKVRDISSIYGVHPFLP